MIASKQIEVLREFDLHGEKKADDLDGLFTSVDVVADEEIILLFRRIADIFECSQQICVLTVYVANDLQNRPFCYRNFDHHRLNGKNALGFF